jgi:transposase
VQGAVTTDEPVLALEGVEEHHHFLLAIQLHRLEAAEHDIEALDSRITEQLEPYLTQHALLMQIPGVDWGSPGSPRHRPTRSSSPPITCSPKG